MRRATTTIVVDHSATSLIVEIILALTTYCFQIEKLVPARFVLIN